MFTERKLIVQSISCLILIISFSGFSFESKAPRGMKEPSKDSLRTIIKKSVGLEDGKLLVIEEVIEKLKRSELTKVDGEVGILSNKSTSKLIVFQEMHNEEIMYYLSCGAKLCELNKSTIYMKPTKEILALPAKNAVVALGRSLSRIRDEKGVLPASQGISKLSEIFSDPLFNETDKLFNDEEYFEVIEVYKKLLLKYENDHVGRPVLFYLIGRSFEELKDCEKAKENFLMVVNNYPKTVWAQLAKSRDENLESLGQCK